MINDIYCYGSVVGAYLVLLLIQSWYLFCVISILGITLVWYAYYTPNLGTC